MNARATSALYPELLPRSANTGAKTNHLPHWHHRPRGYMAVPRQGRTVHPFVTPTAQTDETRFGLQQNLAQHWILPWAVEILQRSGRELGRFNDEALEYEITVSS